MRFIQVSVTPDIVLNSSHIVGFQTNNDGTVTIFISSPLEPYISHPFLTLNAEDSRNFLLAIRDFNERV